ncbi:hypothetical protein HDU98_002452 [Podochytrium sp. JEL0797]|nr:hypothetical protein HDU98_002452 [Podochytrium sp. JEL0797]
MVTRTPAANTTESWIVIGGCGFLGRRMVEMLLERGETKVAIFDLRKTFDDDRVEFFTGDITNLENVEAALAGRTVVLHTASPPHGLPASVYHSVNIDGTRNIVTACHNLNIHKLVYTSSGSVVFNGQSLQEADESMPYCETHMDAYNETKTAAEKIVLESNCDVLRTAALRPSAIFGPKDMQGVREMLAVAKTGKRKFQLGDNDVLFDYTYVDNLVEAHILAAQKLDVNGNGVAGQAFFITNDSPIFFWDFIKLLNFEYGATDSHKYVIPTWLAFVFAYIVEFFVLILSPIKAIHPTLTLFRVRIITQNKYHDISKAKRFLGYKATVSIGEGIRRSVKWFKEEEERVANAASESDKTK